MNNAAHFGALQQGMISLSGFDHTKVQNHFQEVVQSILLYYFLLNEIVLWVVCYQSKCYIQQLNIQKHINRYTTRCMEKKSVSVNQGS